MLSGIRILVVEDEPSVAATLVDVMEDAGEEVIGIAQRERGTSDDPDTGLRCCGTRSPSERWRSHAGSGGAPGPQGPDGRLFRRGAAGQRHALHKAARGRIKGAAPQLGLKSSHSCATSGMTLR
jgi:hypothetical protein